MTLLEVRGITKRFEGLLAVDSVDLDVGEGDIVGVIGPNGAGKTTLFNCMSGLDVPTAGEIRFRGEILRGRPDRFTKAGVARTFQNIRLFPHMTVFENVLVGRHCRTQVGLMAAIGRGPRFRREDGSRGRGRRAAGVRRAATGGRHPGPQPLLRRPAPAGDRPGAGQRAGDPAPRRASGGHEPGRDAGDRRPGAPHPGPRCRRGRHRARHAVHLRPVRPGRRPGPGPQAGGGHAGRGPGRRPGHRGLPRRPRRPDGGAAGSA